MEWIEAPTLKATAAARPAAAPGGVTQPNFGQLAADAGWRDSWSAIIAGRFSPSPYSGLLFVEEGTAYAELYETDGAGHIVAPALRQYNPLGGRTTWTHIVPGIFGSAGYTGLLLYDRAAGLGQLYDSDGQGNFALKGEYTGWRTSWTHIVTGRFVASSPYSSVFFYDAAADYGEVWATDGTGITGTAPYATFSTTAAIVTSRAVARATPGVLLPPAGPAPFTHVVAGDFHWTPGFISQVPTLTDLFFYDAVNGRGEMYRCTDAPDTALFVSAASSAALPTQAVSVAAGNFGGVGNTDLVFFTGPGGTLSFYSFVDTNDTSANLVLRETQTGLRSTVNLVVAGNYRMLNPDDHWFSDGPPVSTPVGFDPDWRFGTGSFSGVLLYDRAAGLGEFYWHEPAPAPPPPIEGYITSQTAHNGALVATGSVLPGESISFHVNSQAGPYSITIYLQGLFAGAAEQMMDVVEGLPANPAPFSIPPNAYRDGAQWPAAASFTIPEWPTGLYLARVQASAAPDNPVDLPFVVRARSSCATGVLMVLSDTTINIYNDWGGRNGYGNVSGSDFAGAYPSTSALRVPFGFQLSFERPLHGGFGNALQTWEIPFIQWLARRGIAVDVCTSRDLHFEAPSLSAYRLLLFAGHHEYWTAEMRDSVETFAKDGGNVGFFSGNVCWWQIRLSSDGRQTSCYKISGFDPVSTTADHGGTTVHWFDDLVKRPETALTGVSWLGDDGIYYDQNHVYTVRNADSWVFAGTGLTNAPPVTVTGLLNNNTFGLYSSLNNGQIDSSVCGGETDRVQTAGPNGLISPPDYTLASIYDLVYPGLEVGTMGMFTPAGGTGVVFNVATNNWALGLSRGETGWINIDQITLNVIARLGPPRPAPWTSVSQGASRPGAPVTAVMAAPNVITLFLADPNGGVYTVSGNAESGWGLWRSVSEGSTTPGAPISAVATGPNQIVLFLSDPGGGVYTATGDANGNWGPWRSVSEGSTTPGAPVTAVQSGPNQIVLFLSDPGGGIYTATGDANGNWGPWSSVSQGSSTPGAPITAVVTAPNRIVLFLSDPGGGIYTATGDANGNWGPWSSVSQGSSTPGAPIGAILTGSNQISLFLADPNGGVYTASGSGGGAWGPWTRVAEGTTTPGARITAVTAPGGRIRLFLTDLAGGVCTTVGSVALGWQPWVNVSEGKSAPNGWVNAILAAPNSVALFISDPGGGTYTSGISAA